YCCSFPNSISLFYIRRKMSELHIPPLS
ncbi:hypothetical protein GCK32_003301, partial [Trichostrongylus colubriformis]